MRYWEKMGIKQQKCTDFQLEKCAVIVSINFYIFHKSFRLSAREVHRYSKV